MNYKKIFFSVLMVALAATISVVLTSCSGDNVKVKPPDPSRLIIGKWTCVYNLCDGYSVEFNENLTYSYKNVELGSGSGTYRILKTLENQKLPYGNDDEGTLFIIGVTSNGVFDQLWVLYSPFISHGPGSGRPRSLRVDYYSNGILLNERTWGFGNVDDF